MKRSLLFPTILSAIVAVLAAGWLGLGLTRSGSSAAQFPAQAGGGAPAALNYQGLLLDDQGNPVTDGAYTLTFALYDTLSGTTALWSETQAVAVERGLFNVTLGAGAALDTAFFDGRPLYLGITLQGEPEMAPRTQLVSVPYALNANDVRNTDIHPANVYVGGGITMTNYGLVVDADGYWHGQPFPAGPTGPQGPTGPTGPEGATGATGPQGLGLTRPGFSRTALDGDGGVDVGRYSSLAIGADGLGLISYYD